MLFPEFNKCAPNEFVVEPCCKFNIEPVEPSPDITLIKSFWFKDSTILVEGLSEEVTKSV